ncbi:hypothetical protein BDZ45DRAFT_660408 [Acephala macrosclerotiorum]|nr:hypothetical protein BDZ45DRAFT_660408 [Acephala macrosclerotiorum]
MSSEGIVDAVNLLSEVSRVLASVAKTASSDTTQTSRKVFLEEIHIELNFLNLYLLQVSNRGDLFVNLANKIILQHSLLESLNLIVVAHELDNIYHQLQQESDLSVFESAISGRFNPNLEYFPFLKQLYIYIQLTRPVTRSQRFDQNPRLLNTSIPTDARKKIVERLRSSNARLAQIKPNNVLLEASKNVGHRLSQLYETLHYNWPECQHCRSIGHPPHTLFYCTSAKLHMKGLWSEVLPGSEEFVVVLCGHNTFHECVIHVSHEHQFPMDNTLRICQSQADATIRMSLKADFSYNLWDSQSLNDLADEAAEWNKVEEVTLDRLVPYNEFNYGETMILGLIVARSFLDMLGTGWFPDEWEMKDISVFRKKDKNDEIAIRSPYLSTNFRKHALASSARGHMLHQRPQVLRLGIVLMQLLLADRLKASGAGFKVKAGTHVNAAVRLARDLLQACKFRFPRNWNLLQGIEQCIDPKAFSRHNAAEDESTLRQFIYQHIVLPLENAVFESERASSMPDIAPTLAQVLEGEAPNAILSNRLEIAPSTEDNPRYEPSHYTEEQRKGSEMYSLATLHRCNEKDPKEIATLWKTEFGAMRKFLDLVFFRTVPLKPLQWGNLVKVAILDTGCDMKHPKIENKLGSEEKFRPGIIGGKDFLNDNDLASIDLSLMTDTTDDLHGTFMAHLVMDKMPFIKLYIAKVFDGNQTKSVRSHNDVAKAIRYAVDEWKVDIISMSFNLHGSTRLVKDAIDCAKSQGVLMFAAACNDLHMKEESIGFPAREVASVFCVNSHNGNRKPSDFTPVNLSERANFAVLGEGLEGPGKASTSQFMNGTSCATPIAAAFAATVLDFSIQLSSKVNTKVWERSMEKVWVDGKNELKDSWLMKKVFFHLMVEDPKRGQYNAIKPWMLFRFKDAENAESEISKEEIQERLSNISRDLIKIVEEKNKRPEIL